MKLFPRHFFRAALFGLETFFAHCAKTKKALYSSGLQRQFAVLPVYKQNQVNSIFLRSFYE